MSPFPPPTPHTPPTPVEESHATPSTGSRRRLVIAAVAATAIGVGGVVAGSQLAGADDEVPTDEATPTADESVDAEPIDDEPVDAEPIDDGDDSDEEATDGANSSDDEHDGGWEFPELDELTASFEEFEQCLSVQLPDLMNGDWFDLEDGELPDMGDWDAGLDDLLGGSVTVFSPDAADGDLTLLDFGDGDGTITITQTDGTISVSTDGDVDTVAVEMPDLGGINLPNFEFEPDPEVDAAFENCTSLLPGDGIFDMVGELVDEFVGEQD